ncbi:hypothetical protein SADUNF_Sadunf04G0042300 [Salix dunnii]|uniref:Uncharacterized protein n=1 Tax=Salix dunnii TaxID=1413687 RepID=A0A835N3W0_9ROSI|nr:hypothetical protein SADUNF_Sadunf04G0042300 [Salix dunnii]
MPKRVGMVADKSSVVFCCCSSGRGPILNKAQRGGKRGMISRENEALRSELMKMNLYVSDIQKNKGVQLRKG